MLNLALHIDFVKSQGEFQRRQAAKYDKDPRRSAMHIASADKFESLLDALTDLNERSSLNADFMSVPPSLSASRLNLSWEEIEGLPEELLSELSVSETDKTEFNIRSLITELGGVASLDRLLVALFKKTGEISKRAALNQRLYRMVQKEMIYAVPGKKGVYSVRQMTDEEANSLI
jgi:hypothetical protein